MALWLVDRQIEESLANLDVDPETALPQARRTVLTLALLAAAGLMITAVWIGRLAHRVRFSGRYPPPGSRLLQDTRIRRDREARLVAAAACLVALALAAAAIALPLLVWRLLALLV